MMALIMTAIVKLIAMTDFVTLQDNLLKKDATVLTGWIMTGIFSLIKPIQIVPPIMDYPLLVRDPLAH